MIRRIDAYLTCPARVERWERRTCMACAAGLVAWIVAAALYAVRIGAI